MATIEGTAPFHPGSTEGRTERPVFSAHNGRRAHAVRVLGRGAAILTGIWLLALVAGAMGFGSLPIIPGSGLLDRATPPAPVQTPRAQSAADRNREASLAEKNALASAADRRADRLAGSTPSARRRARAHPVTPVAPQPPPASQVAAPAAPPVSPGKPQGRAVRRHGDQALLPPPPPANENARGQEVVNPGRVKHQLPPPPPPPPPPPEQP